MKYRCSDSRVVAAFSGRRSRYGRALPVILTGILFLCASSQFAQTPGARPKAVPKTASPTSADAAQKPAYKAIWEPVNYKEDVNLVDVSFVSDQVGWASGGKDAGRGGFILQTKDGGDHWTLQLGDPQSSDPTIGLLRFFDQTHGWAIQAGKLLRTTDGENWEQAGNLPVQWDVVDYIFLSPTDGVLMDGNNNVARILRTSDGGRTWKDVQPTTACKGTIQVQGLSREAECVLKAMHFTSPTIGYAVGGTGQDFNTLFVAKTEDGGNTWTLSHLPDIGPVWVGGAWGAYHSVFFTDPNTGFLNLNNDKLLATNDGGKSWRGLVGSIGPQFKFADREVGWSITVGAHVTFHVTTDGGKRWTTRDVTFPARVNAFSFPTRQRAYVVGQHGMIYRYRVVPVNYTSKGLLEAPMMPPAK